MNSQNQQGFHNPKTRHNQIPFPAYKTQNKNFINQDFNLKQNNKNFDTISEEKPENENKAQKLHNQQSALFKVNVKNIEELYNKNDISGMDLSYVSDETSIQQLNRRNSQKKSSFNLGIPIQYSQFSNIHQQFQSPIIDSHMPIKEMAEDNSSKESTIQKSIHKKSSSQQQLQLNQQQFSTSPYQQQYQSQNDQNSNSNFNVKMSNQQINSNFNINNLNASQNIKSSKQESGSQIDVHLHPSNATPSRPNYTQSNLSLQSMTNSIVHKKYQEPNKGYSSGSSSEFELQIENLHKQNKNDTIEVFNRLKRLYNKSKKQEIQNKFTIKELTHLESLNIFKQNQSPKKRDKKKKQNPAAKLPPNLPLPKKPNQQNPNLPKQNQRNSFLQNKNQLKTSKPYQRPSQLRHKPTQINHSKKQKHRVPNCPRNFPF